LLDPIVDCVVIIVSEEDPSCVWTDPVGICWQLVLLVDPVIDGYWCDIIDYWLLVVNWCGIIVIVGPNYLLLVLLLLVNCWLLCQLVIDNDNDQAQTDGQPSDPMVIEGPLVIDPVDGRWWASGPSWAQTQPETDWKPRTAQLYWTVDPMTQWRTQTLWPSDPVTQTQPVLLLTDIVDDDGRYCYCDGIDWAWRPRRKDPLVKWRAQLTRTQTQLANWARRLIDGYCYWTASPDGDGGPIGQTDWPIDPIEPNGRTDPVIEVDNWAQLVLTLLSRQWRTPVTQTQLRPQPNWPRTRWLTQARWPHCDPGGWRTQTDPANDPVDQLDPMTQWPRIGRTASIIEDQPSIDIVVDSWMTQLWRWPSEGPVEPDWPSWPSGVDPDPRPVLTHWPIECGWPEGIDPGWTIVNYWLVTKRYYGQ